MESTDEESHDVGSADSRMDTTADVVSRRRAEFDTDDDEAAANVQSTITASKKITLPKLKNVMRQPNIQGVPAKWANFFFQ